MKNVIIVIVLLALGALGLYYYQTRVGERGIVENGGNGQTENGTTTPLVYKDLVHVENPRANGTVTSPLRVIGAARGNWYFEASFPIELVDGNGRRIAIAPAQAEGEWMTTKYVPFALELAFEVPTTSTGTLILHKDNPSGLPEHDDSFKIPVRFR